MNIEQTSALGSALRIALMALTEAVPAPIRRYCTCSGGDGGPAEGTNMTVSLFSSGTAAASGSGADSSTGSGAGSSTGSSVINQWFFKLPYHKTLLEEEELSVMLSG